MKNDLSGIRGLSLNLYIFSEGGVCSCQVCCWVCSSETDISRSAVVAREATTTVAVTAGAVKAIAASVVSAEAAVCRRGSKPGTWQHTVAGCTARLGRIHHSNDRN